MFEITPDDLKGATYQEGAYSWPIVDCLGLAVHIRKLYRFSDHKLGGSMFEDGVSEIIDRCQLGPTTKPVPGAILLCYRANKAVHVATVARIHGYGLKALDITTVSEGVRITPLRVFLRAYQKVEIFV